MIVSWMCKKVVLFVPPPQITTGRSTVAAGAAKIQPRRTFAGLSTRFLARDGLLKAVLIAVVRMVLDVAGGRGLEIGLWIEGIALPGVETRGPDIEYGLALFVHHGYVVVVELERGRRSGSSVDVRRGARRGALLLDNRPYALGLRDHSILRTFSAIAVPHSQEIRLLHRSRAGIVGN